MRLGEVEFRNRIMMAPMSQRVAGEDAHAGDWHLVHYGSRAVGGCGLVMVEDTAVESRGRTSHSALGLYEQSQAQALRPIVSFCREQGAAVGLQLAHAGRKAFADTHGSPDSISASPVAWAPGWPAPREAARLELAGVMEAFVAATRLALDADFDVIEIHAAHGYLLHQFLSPLTNFREDDYGSDGVGRARLLLEVVQRVRACWPSGRPLFVRLPAGDGNPGGLAIEEVARIANQCIAAGADLIDVAGGTPVIGGKRAATVEALELAAVLAGDRRPPIALGGGILDGLGAQKLLDDNGASLVSVGRPLLANPYWPLHVADRMGVSAPAPSAYAHALGSLAGEFSSAFGRAVSSPDHSKHIDGCTSVGDIE
jgi:NADPH2 dehydrogenase